MSEEQVQAVETTESASQPEAAEGQVSGEQQVEAQPSSDERLANLEKKLWEQKRQYKEAQDKLSKLSELEQLAAKDPLGAMRHLNIDVVQAVDSILGGSEEPQEPEDINTLKSKFEQELKARDEAWQKRLDETFKERDLHSKQQQYVSQQGRSIAGFISENSEAHPVAAKLLESKNVTNEQLFDAMSLEYDRRVKHSEIHGGEPKIPTPDEVAGILEKEYRQQIKTLQEFLSGINLNEGEASSGGGVTSGAQVARKPSTTLTNRLSTETPKLSVEPKSYEDSRQRALEILQAGLDKMKQD